MCVIIASANHRHLTKLSGKADAYVPTEPLPSAPVLEADATDKEAAEDDDATDDATTSTTEGADATNDGVADDTNDTNGTILTLGDVLKPEEEICCDGNAGGAATTGEALE